MNKKFKQLALQAKMGTADFDAGSYYVATPDRMQLFAELIVRECAEIALEQKKWVEDMKVHNPHDEVWNKARIQQSQHIVDKIKEHFGVEL
jgi:sugar diacid utilization regulator